MTEYFKSSEKQPKQHSFDIHHKALEIPSDFVGDVDIFLGTSDAKLSIVRVADLPQDSQGDHVYYGIKINPKIPFLITGDDGYKGLRIGEQVKLGRDSSYGASKRFPFLKRILETSREHVTISADDQGCLSIEDHSTNGTQVDYSTLDSPEGSNPWADTIIDRRGGSTWDDLADYDSKPEIKPASNEKVSADLERFPERVRLLATPLERNLVGDLFQQSDDQSLKRFEEMFSDDSEDDHQFGYRDVERAAVRIPKREQVSSRSIEDAEIILEGLMCNTQFNSLVGNSKQSSDTIMNKLRSDHVLRCEVITMFMDAIQSVRRKNDDSLASRVMSDDPDNLKSANSDGYEHIGKMLSSEYVAVLMLSMLDGSFDANRADTTWSHNNKDGSRGYGQHREAAMHVLKYLSE